MSLANFAGLSSEKNPVQIYNQGIMIIDSTNAVGKNADGTYTLYVEQADQAVSMLNSHIANASPEVY